MTKELEALKKRIEELDEEEVEKLTQIIDGMINTKEYEQELEQDGYNLQAYRLAVRLAMESGETSDYWGEWYDDALAKLSQ